MELMKLLIPFKQKTTSNIQAMVAHHFVLVLVVVLISLFEVLVFEDEIVNAIIVSHRIIHENLFTQGYITSIWHPPAVG